MRTLIFITAFQFMSSSAFAVPVQLNQHGRLLDNAGAAVDGQRNLVFRIYDASSGGSLLWEETLSINFINGYYAVVLGANTSTNPLNDSVLQASPIFLEIEIGNSGLIGTRTQITSAPYARMAGTALSLSGGTVDATQIGINGSLIIDSSGEWVGPTTPINWSAIQGIPADIDDGDDNLLAGLSCSSGETIGWNGNDWQCLQDNVNTAMDAISAIESQPVDLDPFSSMNGAQILNAGSEGTLSGLLCLDSEGPIWDAISLEWTCTEDEFASSQDLAEHLANTPIDLSSDTTIGGQQILNSASSVSTNWNNIQNIPSDLLDGDNDTLTSLNCQNGEGVGWNGAAWVCMAQSGNALSETTIESYITNSPLDFASGSTIGGEMVLTASQCSAGEILRYDGFEWSCAGFDSLIDADGDSVPAWDDCNDMDPAEGSDAFDQDCDGTVTSEDCDDTDPLSNTHSNDADCDGSLLGEDCNDNDPTAQSSANDADCDGVPTTLDCDDSNPNLLAMVDDADCDGIESTLDCDDNDPSALPIIDDADCDGLATADDCDDNDSNATAVSIDNDCDGVINVDDCDDTDPLMGLLGGVEQCPAQSCLHIADSGQQVDGSYWIDADQDGTAISAYCDLSVDGGGWMRVFGLKHDGAASNGEMDVDTPETGLELANLHRGALSQLGLAQLQSLINFTEIRFFCTKPQGGKILDIKSDNGDVINYFTGQSIFQITANAYSMTRLPSDASLLGQNPSLWDGGTSKWGHNSLGASLRSHPMYITNIANWNAPYGSRYECDDFQFSGNNKAGTWEIYVR